MLISPKRFACLCLILLLFSSLSVFGLKQTKSPTPTSTSVDDHPRLFEIVIIEKSCISAGTGLYPLEPLKRGSLSDKDTEEGVSSFYDIFHLRIQKCISKYTVLGLQEEEAVLCP